MRVEHKSMSEDTSVAAWYYDDPTSRQYVLFAEATMSGEQVTARFNCHTLRDFATGLLDMLALEENRV